MTTERDEEAEKAALDHCRCNLSITQNACPIAERAYLSGVQFQKEREKNPTLLAYGQACKALEKAHFRIKKLEAALDKIIDRRLLEEFDDQQVVFKMSHIAREALKGIK